jgi:broad specificity phosphatase PhoE
VNPVLLYAAVAALPTAAFGALIGGLRAGRRLSEARARPPAAEPLERLEARLRRLRAELEAIENKTGTVAKSHHLQAVRGAYADALAQACQRLDVPPPPGADRARLADIYRTEAALRQRGLDVRETAVR